MYTLQCITGWSDKLNDFSFNQYHIFNDENKYIIITDNHNMLYIYYIAAVVAVS